MKNVNFICPKCKLLLKSKVDEFECGNCNSKYPIIEGIPVFIKNFNEFDEETKQYTKNKKSYKI